MMNLQLYVEQKSFFYIFLMPRATAKLLFTYQKYISTISNRKKNYFESAMCKIEDVLLLKIFKLRNLKNT